MCFLYILYFVHIYSIRPYTLFISVVDQIDLLISTNRNKLHPLCLVCSLEMAVAKIREPLSLINLVKDNPILWDSRNDDYKLTDRKAAF